MADIPDYMRGFDLSEDYGFTPVNKKPTEVQEKVVVAENSETNMELAKVKSDVSSIKSMMNEVMQIVAEKETMTKEVADADTQKRFKDIEKVILPFLYNLSKSDEPYIHWPCLLYTSPSPRDLSTSRMPSSA